MGVFSLVSKPVPWTAGRMTKWLLSIALSGMAITASLVLYRGLAIHANALVTAPAPLNLFPARIRTAASDAGGHPPGPSADACLWRGRSDSAFLCGAPPESALGIASAKVTREIDDMTLRVPASPPPRRTFGAGASTASAPSASAPSASASASSAESAPSHGPAPGASSADSGPTPAPSPTPHAPQPQEGDQEVRDPNGWAPAPAPHGLDWHYLEGRLAFFLAQELPQATTCHFDLGPPGRIMATRPLRGLDTLMIMWLSIAGAVVAIAGVGLRGVWLRDARFSAALWLILQSAMAAQPLALMLAVAPATTGTLACWQCAYNRLPGTRCTYDPWSTESTAGPGMIPSLAWVTLLAGLVAAFMILELVLRARRPLLRAEAQRRRERGRTLTARFFSLAWYLVTSTAAGVLLFSSIITFLADVAWVFDGFYGPAALILGAVSLMVVVGLSVVSAAWVVVCLWRAERVRTKKVFHPDA
ncbi:hypothetical protein H696_01884 [Fonticula alba]|uniref:Uncharacterized protein n=1 Tax=Fonticula alba TaxID=691883 RepID=A0A058ZA00_FONAL|nr:hypothetical protein H696_01884 [Fonticula alba]KCV70936.1 hypothetical protein H696_01884 [Fonticula alba]|eukprot:XP_009494059.1 hypothetical protein H696_01884 [Fonticula alba]